MTQAHRPEAAVERPADFTLDDLNEAASGHDTKSRRPRTTFTRARAVWIRKARSP